MASRSGASAEAVGSIEVMLRHKRRTDEHRSVPLTRAVSKQGLIAGGFLLGLVAAARGGSAGVHARPTVAQPS